MIDKAAGEIASTVLCVLVLRIGLMLLHIGCASTGNVNEIYLQHLVNLGVGTVSYLGVGRVLAQGEDWAGVMGISGWTDWGDKLTILLWGWVMYAAGITELVAAGRLHLLGTVLATTFFTGILHPIIIHQVWCNGWMSGLQDTAGGVVVHLFAGSTAFGALLAMGHKNLDTKPLEKTYSGDSQAAVIGYLLVIAATIQMQSVAIVSNLLYSLLAVSIGLISTTIICMITCKVVDHYVITWVLQGGLSAVVATSCGLHDFNSLLIVLTSLLGTVGFAVFCCLMRMTGLEDYANVLAVHLIPGAISAYLASFDAEGHLIGFKPERILWQALSSLIIFCLSTVLAISVYMTLYYVKLMRDSSEQSMPGVTHGTNPRHWSFFRRMTYRSRNFINPGFHMFRMKRRNRNVDNSKQAVTRRSAEFEDINLENTEMPTTSNTGFHQENNTN